MCRGCEKGFYKETEGVGLCTQCNKNFTTANIGAMRSSDCDIRKENYLFPTSSFSLSSNFRLKVCLHVTLLVGFCYYNRY